MSRPSRPRLLMSAHACSPVRGSEAGSGWNRALTAARRFDTWVLCADVFESEIEAHLRERGAVPGLRFVFLPMRSGDLWDRVHPVWYRRYHQWQKRALRTARRLHREIGFDLVHHVTYNGYREPGYLWRLDVPFVWGPVGGSQNYPWRFLSIAGLEGALLEGTRSLVNLYQLRWRRRVRQAFRAADVVLAANSTNREAFARVHGVDAPVLVDTGLVETSPSPGPRGPEDRLRILWCGILTSRKALRLLLEALGSVRDELDFELTVLGEGPRRRRLERLARRRGISGAVVWRGWVSHEQALTTCSRSDVFVFTSLRDTSGNVVLEALGAGLPVVCLDHQGAHDMVTPECGVKIPVTSPADVVRRLAAALVWLAEDAEARRRLSRGARARAVRFLWETQAETIFDAYDRALHGTRRREEEVWRAPPTATPRAAGE